MNTGHVPEEHQEDYSFLQETSKDERLGPKKIAGKVGKWLGLGLVFGFKFEENFNYPYAATSVSDFWKRWHISLTSWFRQYVYIPLGGNRVENKDRMILNLFIVWLLTGIWHGAEWTFIFWGLWHFMFQIAERLIGYHQNNRHPILMRVYTLLEVMFGWVLFRAKDLYQTNK